MSVKLIRQYTVFLPNVPGALSKFVELFANEGVNIIGIASEIRDDSGVVRVAVDADRKVSHILTGAGFTTIETQMISVELQDKPGQLMRMTKLLGEHNINITTVYGTADTGHTGRLLMNASDVDKALEILKAELNGK
ncbi:MAG: ACT domain-containing protein [Elusimicrobiales bacterium]|nr:ACT domain-containing protein [Elusimicrobiales bacterium]